MKKFIDPANAGGAPIFMDDIVRLQETEIPALEMLKAINGGLPFIISGCEVTGPDGGGLYDIAPGYIFINSAVIKFNGVNNVANYAIYEDTPVITSRAFNDGVVRSILQERLLTGSTGVVPFGVEAIILSPDTDQRLEIIVSGYNTNEAWHYVGDTSEPTWHSGWGNYGSPGADASRFRKSKSNIVQVEFNRTINTTTTTIDSPQSSVFILPSGYRPATQLYRPIYKSYSDGNAYAGIVSIETSGEIQAYHADATGMTQINIYGGFEFQI